MGIAINRYHGSYNVSRRSATPKYIVMHYVGAGSSAAGSARANCVYFAGGNRDASAHYFVDDGGIWEFADPATYATWHCGDGKGKFGITNGNSIGVEVCINGDQPYTANEIGYAAQLVQHLMSRFGIPAERVVRHYDASRKACPYFYTPHGAGGDPAWATLRAVLTGSQVAPEGTGGTGGSAPSGGNSSGNSGTKLLLDCDCGKLTMAEWARQLGLSGSDADGYVSKQYTGNRRYLKNMSSVIYDWYRGTSGSPTVRAIQRRIGSSNVDGVWGAVDTERLRQYMRQQWGYKMSSDGYGVFGANCAYNVQHSLNAGLWRR